MALKQRMENGDKVLVKDLNSVLTCTLCNGYFIDAATLTECLHTFCRSCILKYHEENSKSQCPECPTDKKKLQSLRSDPQIQSLVYKLVPSLYVKEMQRREEFYRSTGIRSGSSCSEDSVLDRERDVLIEREEEEMISKCVGDRNQYFSPDDSISLSLEYYQSNLDKTDVEKEKRLAFLTCNRLKDGKSDSIDKNVANSDIKTELKCSSTSNSQVDKENNVQPSENNVNTIKNNGQIVSSSDTKDNKNPENDQNLNENTGKNEKNTDSSSKICDKRYLQCPAAVNMSHLQKFVRMKFGLTGDHRVDIIYKGEVLPTDISLMDVAYTYKWERIKPMRFFYRIFSPMRKISPIKIVTKASSTGGKQLQVVPLSNANGAEVKTEKIASRTERQSTEKTPEKKVTVLPQETEKQRQDKERLMANLQLQSKAQALQNSLEAKKPTIPDHKLIKDYIFEYEHQSPEEIKKFAERRDREWALQKKLEEDNREDYHVTKKRKKSKHSKNDSTSYKKRKIHAEITSNEKDDLKVKLKISSNGHKHKHHKILESADTKEMSAKEKLLQLRQVRPKHLSQSGPGSGDEKSQPANITLKLPKAELKPSEEKPKPEPKPKPPVQNVTKPYQPVKVPDKIIKPPLVTSENNNSPIESQIKPNIEQIKPRVNQPAIPRPNIPPQVHSINRFEPPNKMPRKETGPRPNLNHFTAQKTFPKVSQSITKVGEATKVVPNQQKLSTKPFSVNSVGAIKNIERKVGTLPSRVTIESRNPQNNTSQDTKTVSFTTEKRKILTPQYHPGFTVSKVEQGVKRKAEDLIEDNDKGLEIFLINPQKPAEKNITNANKTPANRRPIPGAIPVNPRSGVSITPKPLERKEPSAPLDLSKATRPNEIVAKIPSKQEPVNGLNRQLNNLVQRPMGSPGRNAPDNKTGNPQISNLQLLSKVATEHLNKNPVGAMVPKPRPQMPSLQNIRLAQMHQSLKLSQIQRLPPKLNEIQKFRPRVPQIRSMRPPNQNIRNIPNPSLLINRQQQRLANPVSSSTQGSNLTQTSANNNPEKVTTDTLKTQANLVSTTTNSSNVCSKDLNETKAVTIEPKIQEKAEVAV